MVSFHNNGLVNMFITNLLKIYDVLGLFLNPTVMDDLSRVSQGKNRVITPEVFSVAIMIWLTGTKYPFHR